MTIAAMSVSHGGMGAAKCTGVASRQCNRESSGFRFRRQGLEVTLNLLPVGGRRRVVHSGSQPIAGLLGLELLRKRGLGSLERSRGLFSQLLPLREVLLERLGSRRREDHALAFEGEAAPALRVAAVFAPELVDQLARLLKLPVVLIAQPSQNARAAGAGAPACPPVVARRALRARRRGRRRRELASEIVDAPAQLLSASALVRELARLIVSRTLRAREGVSQLVERAGQLPSGRGGGPRGVPLRG